MSKINEPRAHQIHRQNADRMCLVSFVAVLSGVVVRQVRYAHPTTLQEALNLTLAVDEAERQERLNETIFTLSDAFTGQLPRSASKKNRERNESARPADPGASSQQNIPTRSVRSGTQDSSSPRCYECGCIRHFSRECPSRLKRLGSSTNWPVRRNPSERSKRRSSSSEKPPNVTTRGGTKETPMKGNE